MNNADWWAQRLAQQPQQPVGRPDPTPTMPPSQQPMAGMPQFQQQAAPTNATAQSASQTTSCPDCGSSNFMAVAGAKPRCFDCGYPTEQSGSRYGSLTGAKVQGSAKQATGNNPTSNWSPIPAGYNADGSKQ
jgi:ribosomal protein S27AE